MRSRSKRPTSTRCPRAEFSSFARASIGHRRKKPRSRSTSTIWCWIARPWHALRPQLKLNAELGREQRRAVNGTEAVRCKARPIERQDERRLEPDAHGATAGPHRAGRSEQAVVGRERAIVAKEPRCARAEHRHART